MLHSTEVKAEDGTVYRRNASGVYFQIEQAWTSFDGSNGLEVGDEVLAVDNYKMVDMSLDTARLMLEDQARSGCVTVVAVRQPLDEKLTVKCDSIVTAPQDFHDQDNRNLDATKEDSVFSPTSPSPADFTVDLVQESTSKSLGIDIFGGADTVKGPPTVFIKTLSPDGLAAYDGRLYAGDEIIAINDASVAGLTNAEVLDLMQRHADAAQLRITARRHVMQRISSSPNDEETPRAPPRRRKSNVELSRTSRTSSNMENMAAVDECDAGSNAVKSEKQEILRESEENVSQQRPSCDDNHLHTDEAPIQLTDTNAGNEIETKSAVIADDYIDNNALSYEQSQPIGEDLCSSKKKVSRDWNANESLEISASVDPADVDAVLLTEHGDEQESRVRLNSDEESTSNEVLETHVEPESAVVAAVIASPSYSAPPAMTNILNDDAPPPLPTSLPPASSFLPPDHDASQELSVLVEEDNPQSTASAISPPSPYANSEPDTSVTEIDARSNAATEPQSHSEEDPTDIYSALSDEERLLVQRILMTTQENHTSVQEETILHENYRNSEPQDKCSDLSDYERKLIESSLTSLGDRQPDVHNYVCVDGANSATFLELPAGESANEDGGNEDSDRNTCTDGAEREICQQSPWNQDQEPDKDVTEEVETVSSSEDKENVSSTEVTIQHSPQNEDQEPHQDVSEEVEVVSSSENVILNEGTIQESSQGEIQEPGKTMSEEVEDDSIGTTLSHEVKTSELTVRADQLASNTTTSPFDDLTTSTSLADNPVNSHPSENFEETTVIVPPEISDKTASENEQSDTRNHLVTTANILPDNVNAIEGYDGRPVNVHSENYSETTVVVPLESSVDEAPEKAEPSTTTDTSSKSTDDVSRNHGNNVPSDAHSRAVETGALTKSRRTLQSDEAVSGILRDYYTVDAEVEEQKPEPEKPKPVKPLIAQALLPKALRGSAGTLNAGSSITVAAGALPQTSSSFSSSKLGYSQVEIPRAILLSEKSEAQGAEDNQRTKLVGGQDSDDVTHDDVTASRDSFSESMRGSNIGVERLTSSDTERSDGREVPTIEESRAFFRSREATTKNCSEKSFPVRSNPVAKSSSTVEVKLNQETSSTSSKIEESETQPVEAALSQTSQKSSTIASSQPLTSGPSATSLPTSLGAQTEILKPTESSTALAGRAPLTTRWTPKPFSLTTSTTKATPKFMTFEPFLRTEKIPETRESDVPTDSKLEVTKVESSAMSTSSPSSSNSLEKVGNESASAERTPKRNSSLTTMTTTVGADGSVGGSSAADEDEWTSKSSDVDIDAVGISIDVVMCQAVEPQSPSDKHPPMSAAAMATELKKRTPSLSGPSRSLNPTQNSSSTSVGRSLSMSHVDVQPKSERPVLQNGCKSTNRGAPMSAKSWTQFDYRKMVAPTRTEAIGSTVGGQDSRTSFSDIDEGHINMTSSKAFFQAAEQAEKQALNQPGASKTSRKPVATSSVKTVAPVKDNEDCSTVAAEIDLTSSSESSCSAHTAAFVTTPDGTVEETTTTASQSRLGPTQRASFSSADVTNRSKAWKQFISSYSK